MATDELCPVKEYTYHDLRLFTDDFSDDNYIGITQFGKVYHGRILLQDEKLLHVTVKIWADRYIYEVEPQDKVTRMKEEVHLLQHRELNTHPNLAKLLGFCYEGEHVGVVYDFRSIGTIYSLCSKGDFGENPSNSVSFTWLRRIKAAVGLACALYFFHNVKHNDAGYLVRNIGPRHVMLDEDFCPRIFDFGMLSGGFVSDKRNIKGEKLEGCYGYSATYGAVPGNWNESCDIYSYGGVLIGLLANKVFKEEEISWDEYPFVDLYYWAGDALKENRSTNIFGRMKCSLVHESLKADQGYYRSDGYEITELMMRCGNKYSCFRPTTMKEVVHCLLKLRVVQKHADFMGVKDMLQRYKKRNFLKDYIKGSNYFRDLYCRSFLYHSLLDEFGRVKPTEKNSVCLPFFQTLSSK